MGHRGGRGPLSAPSGKLVTGELLSISGGYRMWGDVWPAGAPAEFDVVRARDPTSRSMKLIADSWDNHAMRMGCL